MNDIAASYTQLLTASTCILTFTDFILLQLFRAYFLKVLINIFLA